MLSMRLGTLVFVIAALFSGSATAFAQDATPDTGFDPVARFPAHVLSGTCAEPGDIAFELADGGYGLPAPLAGDAESVTATYIGPTEANPAIVSVTTIDAALTDIVSGGHSIDVHSAGGGDEAATRIVCGVAGGFLAGDDLVFGLQEVNASDNRGAAWLHDNGDDTTTVTLFLISPFASPTGTDQESTAAGQEPAGSVAADPGVPEAVVGAGDESLTQQPPVNESAGLVVEGGDFAAEQMSLLEDVPTVLHFVNSDDQDYIFEIDDLVTAQEVPANQLTVIEFTTPSEGTFQAQLHDAGTDAVLATIPVAVGAVPALAP